MISRLALIASSSGYVGFAMTLAGYHTKVRMLLTITNASIERTIGITVARDTHVWISQILALVMIESFNASFASGTFSVVLTLVTDTTGCFIVCFIDDWIKVAFVRVVVTVAS